MTRLSAIYRARGLTLIELMIAIAIVGILSSIATVRYLGYIEKVRVTRSILDLKTIQTEIDGLNRRVEWKRASAAELLLYIRYSVTISDCRQGSQ